MGIHRHHIGNIVLFPGAHAGNALAAPVLGRVGIRRKPFDIAGTAHGNDRRVPLDQVLNVDFVFHLADFGQPVVSVALFDVVQFLFENADQHFVGIQNRIQISDPLFDLLILRLQFFLFQPLQSLQTHFQNGRSLHLRKVEPGHQVLLGIIVGIPDDPDHFIDVCLGDQQSLQKMGSFLGFPLFAPGTP